MLAATLFGLVISLNELLTLFLATRNTETMPRVHLAQSAFSRYAFGGSGVGDPAGLDAPLGGCRRLVFTAQAR
jgi:hypothetical protein